MRKASHRTSGVKSNAATNAMSKRIRYLSMSQRQQVSRRLTERLVPCIAPMWERLPHSPSRRKQELTRDRTGFLGGKMADLFLTQLFQQRMEFHDRAPPVETSHRCLATSPAHFLQRIGIMEAPEYGRRESRGIVRLDANTAAV